MAEILNEKTVKRVCREKTENMKQYHLILADPPWRYSVKKHSGSAENHYSTMSLRALQALPVRELADADCVLLLWCTWPQLVNGIELMQYWGFRHKTGFPWIKIRSLSTDLFSKEESFTTWPGIGYWVRGVSEMILIGTRGNVHPPREMFSGLLSKRLQHSRKPDSIYHYAESLPGPYLELFARRPRVGWNCYGNEVDDIIDIDQYIKPCRCGCGEKVIQLLKGRRKEFASNACRQRFFRKQCYEIRRFVS